MMIRNKWSGLCSGWWIQKNKVQDESLRVLIKALQLLEMEHALNFSIFRKILGIYYQLDRLVVTCDYMMCS